MRISDWSSDVCSSDLALPKGVKHNHGPLLARAHFLRGMLNPTRGKEINAQLPMFWIGGLMMFLITDWTAGALTACTGRTLNNSRFSVGSDRKSTRLNYSH